MAPPKWCTIPRTKNCSSRKPFPTLEGFERSVVTELGAVNVMTGVYTGRSPKDKFIVLDEKSKDTVWWTTPEYPNDNKPASEAAWDACKTLALSELSGKKLYVVDCFCGANKDTRMAVRFIMEVAWRPLRDQHVYPSYCRRPPKASPQLHRIQRIEG